MKTTLSSFRHGGFHDIPVGELDREDVGKAANTAFLQKKAKYQGVCDACGFSFIPLIFESTGFMHSGVKAYLRSLAANCSTVKKISPDILYNHFVKRLSFRLQSCFASNIVHRLHGLNGRVGYGLGPAWNDQLILEEGLQDNIRGQ